MLRKDFEKPASSMNRGPIWPILLCTIQLLYLLTSRCETVRSSPKEGTVSSCLTESGGRSLEGGFGSSPAPTDSGAVKVCEVVNKASCEVLFVKSACHEVRSVISSETRC